MSKPLALAVLLALVAAAAAARPALECVPASTVIPSDGSFSLFPKQFHIVSSTQPQANTSSLATTVRCGHSHDPQGTRSRTRLWR